MLQHAGPFVIKSLWTKNELCFA